MLSLCSGLATSILDDYTYNKQQKMKNDHPGSDGYILLDDDDLLDYLFYNNTTKLLVINFKCVHFYG